MTVTLPETKQSRDTQTIGPLNARVMLAGMPGAGKTSLLASWAPDTTLLIDTQKGTTLLDGEHYVSHVGSWPEFTSLVDQLVAGEHGFKTVGIDMGDDLWLFCDKHHAGRNRALASATDDYGKAIKQAQGVFRSQLGRLFATDLGVWVTSHVLEERDGDLVRYRSRLDKNVLTYVQGACQFILLAETLGPKRLLHTAPSAKFEAKARVSLPEPMALNARELYAAMAAGLNNTNGRDA